MTRVFIACCLYRPHPEYLRAQLDSFRGQTHGDWRCLLQEDGEPASEALVRSQVGDDPRFSYRATGERLGVFHNFETALRFVPGDCPLICYSDQDDVWEPDKLAAGVALLADPAITLIHSDLAVVDAEGTLLHPSCFAFEGRVAGDFSLGQLLLRNSVTGCTAMFRASLLPRLLPFPAQGREPAYLHDSWTALIAAGEGRIGFVARPLVRYRQHGGNVAGAVPFGRPAGPRRKVVERWRSAIKIGALRHRLIADLAAAYARPPAARRPTFPPVWWTAVRHRLAGDPQAPVTLRIALSVPIHRAALLWRRFVGGGPGGQTPV